MTTSLTMLLTVYVQRCPGCVLLLVTVCGVGDHALQPLPRLGPGDSLELQPGQAPHPPLLRLPILRGGGLVVGGQRDVSQPPADGRGGVAVPDISLPLATSSIHFKSSNRHENMKIHSSKFSKYQPGDTSNKRGYTLCNRDHRVLCLPNQLHVLGDYVDLGGGHCKRQI